MAKWAGIAIGITAGLVAPPLLLGAAGFTAGGVAAGSIAAAVQASIGNVAAGSLFAACQSAGAAGLSGAATAMFATAGGAMGAAFGHLFDSVAKAKDYKKYRPEYCKTLFDKIMSYVRSSPVAQRVREGEKLSIAVDVGCGSGQSTTGLVAHFKQIIAVDSSKLQIAEAKNGETSDNVEFKVASAESLPVQDASVDLVTVGMSLHYLDWAKFYKEVDRVLKPGGVIAAYMYSMQPTIVNHPKAKLLNDIITKLLRDDPIKNHWHKGDECLDASYTEEAMQIPYPDTCRDDIITLPIKGSIDTLFGYLGTLSPVGCYLKEKGKAGEDFWKSKVKEFCEICGTEDMNFTLKYEFNTLLLLGRKPLL